MSVRGGIGSKTPRGITSFVIAWACVAVCVTSCTPPSNPTGAEPNDGAITVASFDFTESDILAEIYAQALEGAGYPIRRAFGVGPREILQPALEKGLVELVPEYAGTALEFATLGKVEASPDAVATRDRLANALEGRGLTVLASSRAQDSNAVVVTAGTAARYDLRTISDLARVPRRLVLGGPRECPQRPLCMLGLHERYGLRFSRFVPLDASGPFTAAALAAGQVDVAVLFSTDGDLAGDRFVALQDDRSLQPAENVTPIVRTSVVSRYGDGLVQVVNRVSSALTTEDLARLNLMVETNTKSPHRAAADWLRMNGFVQ